MLQVMLSCVPFVASNVSWILEFAVTCELFTTTLEAPAAMATVPSISVPQTAGEAAEKHWPAVNSVEVVVYPTKEPAIFKASKTFFAAVLVVGRAGFPQVV